MKVTSRALMPLLAAALMIPTGAASMQPETSKPVPGQATTDPYVLDFKVKSIEGKEIDLAQYRGKVVVIVNVASKCGYTPQYEGLQKLFEEKKDQGLVILGFPANNFKEQEPGTNEEIASFCRERYGVTFPLFEKISVAGPDQHPLYRKLQSQPAPIGGEPPKWNFTKFVVDRSGNVVARFDADRRYIRTATLEPELVSRVEQLLSHPSQEPKGPADPAPRR